MADRVFEDRVGLYVISPENLSARLGAIATFQDRLLRDVFLPRNAQPAHFAAVRQRGLYAHLWAATDGLPAADYADRTLADIARLRPGAAELNVELPSDPPLAGYIREVVGRIRRARPSYRLRLNVAPWKAFALPIDLLHTDGALYACEQTYGGNMDELYSPADVLSDMLLWGAPLAKVSVCYAAACRVLGSSARQRTLPDLSRRRRGVVFSDDLMAEVGLL